ncbi:MAG: glycoside hydrolase family 20 zincin-like fold domain-containing protein, partial [Alistipes sp.]|nr:glycoside hydrolase family 20 zincin-like fold domain-containing protein [Alistipes sp.]
MKSSLTFYLMVIAMLSSYNLYGFYLVTEPPLNNPRIVPRPVTQLFGEGYFTVSDGTGVVAGDEVDWDLLWAVRSTVRRAYPERWRMPLPEKFNTIELKLSDKVKHKEGYRIEISPDTISIE